MTVILAVQEVFVMEDPVVTSFSEPMNLEERADLVPLVHKDYDFVFGFSELVVEKDTGTEMSMPPEIGTWIVISVNSKGPPYVESSLLDCRDVIDEEISAVSNPEISRQSAAGFSRCMDPQDTQWGRFNDFIGDDDGIHSDLYFKPCTEYLNEGKQIYCYSKE